MGAPPADSSSTTPARPDHAASRVPLTGKQKGYLRGLAHSLEPVVQLGKHGLTAAVKREIDLALEAHELIKVKLPKEADQTPADMSAEIQAELGARSVQQIGHLLLLYRARQKEPRIVLPKSAGGTAGKPGPSSAGNGKPKASKAE